MYFAFIIDWEAESEQYLS